MALWVLLAIGSIVSHILSGAMASDDVRVFYECHRTNDTILVTLIYSNVGEKAIVVDGSGLIGPAITVEETLSAQSSSTGWGVWGYSCRWIPLAEIRTGLTTVPPGGSVRVPYDMKKGTTWFLGPSRRDGIEEYFFGPSRGDDIEGRPVAFAMEKSITNATGVVSVGLHVYARDMLDRSIGQSFVRGRRLSDLLGFEVFGWERGWHTDLRFGTVGKEITPQRLILERKGVDDMDLPEWIYHVPEDVSKSGALGVTNRFVPAN